MKRIDFTIVAIFAILGLTAAPALAASPHFVTASGATDDDGNLVVNFKIAGLGDTAARR